MESVDIDVAQKLIGLLFFETSFLGSIKNHAKRDSQCVLFMLSRILDGRPTNTNNIKAFAFIFAAII